MCGMRYVLVLLLLGLAVGAPAAAATRGSGFYGVVMRGPTKPVCAAEEACSEPAVHSRLRFLRAAAPVATVVTDSRGRYRLRLPGGVYAVRVAGTPASGIGGRIAPAKVRVRATWRHQDFDIDTGIR
jgi:hypothetical protein